MLDVETCINIDNLDANQIVEKILYYSEPERYSQMCQNVYKNFRDNVDFDREEENIRHFLDNLI